MRRRDFRMFSDTAGLSQRHAIVVMQGLVCALQEAVEHRGVMHRGGVEVEVQRMPLVITQNVDFGAESSSGASQAGIT